MREAYFTIAWTLGQTEIIGPYDSFDTAMSILGEDTLGEPRHGGVIGPVPFKQLIEDGEWIKDTAEPAPTRYAVLAIKDEIMSPEWVTYDCTLEQAIEAAEPVDANDETGHEVRLIIPVVRMFGNRDKV